MVWVIIGSIVLGLVVLDLIALALIIRVVVPWFEKGPPFNVEASPPEDAQGHDAQGDREEERVHARGPAPQTAERP